MRVFFWYVKVELVRQRHTGNTFQAVIDGLSVEGCCFFNPFPVGILIQLSDELTFEGCLYKQQLNRSNRLPENHVTFSVTIKLPLILIPSRLNGRQHFYPLFPYLKFNAWRVLLHAVRFALTPCGPKLANYLMIILHDNWLKNESPVWMWKPAECSHFLSFQTLP